MRVVCRLNALVDDYKQREVCMNVKYLSSLTFKYTKQYTLYIHHYTLLLPKHISPV